ncbi:MAG TPA: ABC transporter substrate-binding protein [Solirubrobacteraceae bacterium]|nr:ABC transporter substrate-binding protein [Solirubrobacteraceae bacterium]
MRPSPMRTAGPALAAALSAIALVACGGSSAGSGGGQSSTASAGQPVNGGTLTAAIPANPDHLDPGLSYATEGWELLEATNDGLLRFKPEAGPAGAQIVPDLATAMPKVSDGGRTYTFHMRANVKFSPPVNRDVEPSDIKFSIERLFRINSGGVGFYTGIAGADRYEKTRKGGISGIVADDKTHTIAFHLTKPDGTFLEYMAIPFAFAVPAGTPNRDISTVAKWRVATGPYMFSQYTPSQSITIVRNPNFHQWTKYTPNGHLDKIQITIGNSPEDAMNEIADGQLDWYFEAVPPDRLAQLRARYPSQVHVYPRNDITYFLLNTRKPPFTNLKVRQAINYATDRTALVKIFGGQGTPTENIIPPSLGAAYKRQWPYPYDLAKAKQLVAESGTKGMTVNVWSHSTDPVPKAAQYMASVLDTLGYKATVKTLSEGVYWDTISTQAGDPQVAFVQFDQDYPEGQDFIDVQLNGERITNVGNQNTSNFDDPAINRQIDAARAMPLGAARDAQWVKLDREIMAQAPWVPFLNRTLPKFDAPNLHGLVFNGTYYEMFPEMWLSK